MSAVTIINNSVRLSADNLVVLSEDESTPCCCCGYYFSTHPSSTSFWGTGNLPPLPDVVNPAVNPEDFETNDALLDKICLIVCGDFPLCGYGITDTYFSRPAIKQWLEDGGILCIKDEFEPDPSSSGGFLCGRPDIVQPYLQAIGSAMTDLGGDYSCEGPVGYDAVLDNLRPITRGLPATIHSFGNTGKIVGGTPLIFAPECARHNRIAPAAIAMAAEKVQDGLLVLVVDSNLDPVQKLTANAVAIKSSGTTDYL